MDQISCTLSAPATKAALSMSTDRRRRAMSMVLSGLCCFFVCGTALAGPHGSEGTVPDTSSDEAQKSPDNLRAWTPRVSVALREFYYDPTFSPDGAHFFFLTRHGDLSCDCNIEELNVFSTEAVQRALKRVGSSPQSPLKPLRTLKRRSAPGYGYKGGIDAPRWESDGQTISFQGVDDDGFTQFYVFDIRSGTLRSLTNWKQEGHWFERHGDTVISQVYIPKPEDPVYPVHVITRAEIDEALAPKELKDSWETTFVSYRGDTPWPLTKTEPLHVPPSPIYSASFTQDGRRGVMLRLPKDVPPYWYEYDRLNRLADTLHGHSRFNDPLFVFVDAEHRRATPALHAPAGLATDVGFRASSLLPKAMWAEDQRPCILVNTAVPLTAAGSSQNEERKHMAYVVSYDANTGDWEVIEPLESRVGDHKLLRRVTAVNWLAPGRELLIRHAIDGKPAKGTVYTLTHGHWKARSVSAELASPAPSKHMPRQGFSVTLKQGANEPFVMVATDGKHTIALTPPDPALEGVRLARSRPYQWRDSTGRTITGGLLLPDTGKKKVPLVIQAYYYNPQAFLPDGPFSTHLYAAQTLVARGMAVLNMQIPSAYTLPIPEWEGTRELPTFNDHANSAIAALSKEGIIDPMRVGLIGFSRAGFNIYYLITHPETHPPAAAIIDDSFTGTYGNYLNNIAQSGLVLRTQFEGIYGGPFWQNKAAWLERETSFNVDRVETPALFTLHGQKGLSFIANTMGAFVLNRRPFEFLIYPHGRHFLSSPRERLASIEISADWMSFWLQNKPPANAERAARWLAIKTEWDRVCKEEHTPGAAKH